MTEKVECVVVGAGVIGLAVARALALGGREVLILEAEQSFGRHTSSRNSEVIHAGIYYPPGSLKARTCVRGKALLYQYCRQRRINHRQIGKLIVANSSSQLKDLEAYLARGQANGLQDLEILSRKELLQKEAGVSGIAALWSPSTGIVDSHGLMLSLLAEVENANGTLVTRSPVLGFRGVEDGFEIEVGQARAKLQTHYLVNAAGHGAQSLARASGQADAPRSRYAAGHYYTCSGKSPFGHLVYPVAEAGSLGLHATNDLGGQLKFGPDLEWRDRLDYSFDDSDTRRRHFAGRIHAYYPGLDPARLQAGYVGVRPRISAPGEPAADFMIEGPGSHGMEGLVQLFGIESPGLTASLAIAEEVVRQLLEGVSAPIVG
jgi:L-2-hydroxyglutarate oxidase LhgO